MLFVLCSLLIQSQNEPDEKLGTIPKEFYVVRSPVFSPDARKVAFSASSKGKCFVVVGDQQGPNFDYTRELSFARNSSQFAYVGTVLGKGDRVNIGDKTGEPFDSVGALVLSPDGLRAAHWAKKGGKALLVSGDLKIEGCTLFGNPVFSPNGKLIAYPAEKDSKWFVSAHSSATAPTDFSAADTYDDVTDIIFSADSARVAYCAKDGKTKNTFIIVAKTSGDKLVTESKFGPFVRAGWPVFSPTNKDIAYLANSGNGDFMAVGDTKHESVYPAGPAVFSPDGRSVAYQVMKEGKRYISVDGQAKELFRAVGTPIFSPDGKTLAYAAQLQDFTWTIVVGESKTEGFDYVSDPMFSADGNSVVFGAKIGAELWRKTIKKP